MRATNCKYCDKNASAGGRYGRRKHRSWLVDGSQVAGCEKPSSPALRTKETVERLSLFCQSIVAKAGKAPWFPRDLGLIGYFSFSFRHLHLFAPISARFRRLGRRCGDRNIVNMKTSLGDSWDFQGMFRYRLISRGIPPLRRLSSALKPMRWHSMESAMVVRVKLGESTVM